MTNPLLENTPLPDFSRIDIAHFKPAITQLLADNRRLVKEIVETGDYSWDGLVYPLEQAADELNNAWSVITHYKSVLNSDELREIYKELLAELTDYFTELGQNQDLYESYLALSESDEFEQLNPAQRKVIENELRDFKLAGVALENDKKQEYTALKKALSELTNTFSENVLDATQGWTKYIEDVAALDGLPESALSLLESLAKEHGHDEGFLITLDFPSYLPVMTYCKNRELREELYTAFMTRASDQGPNAGQWDNSELILQIMDKRQQLAKLLSFSNYAERSLATKMANEVDEVIHFLEELAQHSLPSAKEELETLEDFARECDDLTSLEAWDTTYYSEKLRQHRFDISQEELRPYFPAPVVINGMFDIVGRLYGIEIVQGNDAPVYHPDVQYYEVCQGEQVLAGFYLDLYARKDKRGGAWMSDCRVRRRLKDGSVQKPIAFLTCNFTPSVDGQDSLLTHDEVTTLFHEFGHGLHHMLTKIDVSSVSGINGVPWDVVELPSQFLENWCWHEESIGMMSAHHETGDALPKSLLDKMLAAKHFQSSMMMVRQLEFALFDFLLHRDFEAGKTDVLALLDEVRDRVAVKKPPAFSRFSHSFSHIFAGGYAAGYYSYKWAEVLAADAFSRFEEEGLFNTETGASFRKEILEVGGSKDAMDMFVAFRGRKPSVEPLLKQSGITL